MNSFIIIVLAIATYGIYLYNKLIRQRFLVKEGWSGVDVQLKRRHDLIPNLVELVKAYASHEKETLEHVTELRSQSEKTTNIKEKGAIEKNLAFDVKKVIALVEAYPDLKADKNFRELQENLVEIEDQLQYSRRYYNGTVRDHNTTVESFPANLLANFLGFESADFFEIEYVTEREKPDVDF